MKTLPKEHPMKARYLALLAPLALVALACGSSSHSDKPAFSPVTESTAPAPASSPSAPLGPRVTFGDGVWEVNKDIKPGKYKTIVPAGSFGCLWQRLRDTSGDSGAIIALDSGEPGAQLVVSIKKTDVAFDSSGCGTWSYQGAA